MKNRIPKIRKKKRKWIELVFLGLRGGLFFRVFPILFPDACFDCFPEFLGRAGLAQYAEELAGLQGLRAPEFKVGMSGQKDGRGGRMFRLDSRQKLDPGHAGHAHVRDHDIERAFFFHGLKGILSVICEGQVEGSAQVQLDAAENGSLVIDYQYLGVHALFEPR